MLLLRDVYCLFRFTTRSLRQHSPRFQSQSISMSHQKRNSKRRKVHSKPIKEGSVEEVLHADVCQLLTSSRSSAAIEQKTAEAIHLKISSSHVVPERFTEVEVDIIKLSSTGDGLGLSADSDHVFVVPFTVPGDVVKAKTINTIHEHHYTLTDLVKVISPSTRRDESLIKCPYFGRCSGCQLQMLSYEQQLTHKMSIIEKAYRNFSSLTPENVPLVGDTIGSPLQYGYRTKLTPHFDGPPGSQSRKVKRNAVDRPKFDTIPPIGFMMKGIRKTLDIEDCPIGTDAVRAGMKNERARVAQELSSYKRGATLLLRESTLRIPKSASKGSNVNGKEQPTELEVNVTSTNRDRGSDVAAKTEDRESFPYIEKKMCVTDQNAKTTEYVNDYIFSNKAGAFFQNNNSILPAFTAYIREHILPKESDVKRTPVKYLIDAYCGSGLFTVTLSSLFASSTGIDIAEPSIVSAIENAKANNISNANFIIADASALFKEVAYPPDETVIVIDPPRKGCDNAFLKQLLQFGPQRVVYVSCNVHTQARDVGILVNGDGGCIYEIESLRGFDFFPQTGHVEGIAILKRSASPPLEKAGQ